MRRRAIKVILTVMVMVTAVSVSSTQHLDINRECHSLIEMMMMTMFLPLDTSGTRHRLIVNDFDVL